MAPTRRGARQACVTLAAGVVIFIAMQIAASAALDLWLPGAIDPDYGSRLQCIHRGAPPIRNKRAPSSCSAVRALIMALRRKDWTRR